MTLLTPHSLPIRPTRPASQVTPSGLPTSGADESIQEEGSATLHSYMPRQWVQRNINYLAPPWNLHIWASSWGRPQHWCMRGGTRHRVCWTVTLPTYVNLLTYQWGKETVYSNPVQSSSEAHNMPICNMTFSGALATLADSAGIDSQTPLPKITEPRTHNKIVNIKRNNIKVLARSVTYFGYLANSKCNEKYIQSNVLIIH